MHDRVCIDADDRYGVDGAFLKNLLLKIQQIFRVVFCLISVHHTGRTYEETTKYLTI
jgi:hypothetical protein